MIDLKYIETKNAKMSTLAIVLTIVAIIVILMIGAYIYTYFYVDSLTNNHSVAALCEDKGGQCYNSERSENKDGYTINYPLATCKSLGSSKANCCIKDNSAQNIS